MSTLHQPIQNAPYPILRRQNPPNPPKNVYTPQIHPSNLVPSQPGKHPNLETHTTVTTRDYQNRDHE